MDLLEAKLKQIFYNERIPTWRYHHSEFPRANVLGHTNDRAIDVDNGFSFSLDIPTPYPMDLNKLDDEVNGPMYTMQKD